jgi:DNA (cytosine-5)-methyltransferase 1
MKSLEIFSGAGGLAKGLELSGFNHAAFVEFNKDACATLRTNFEPEKVFFGDVRDFKFSSLNQVDIVAGGPPCQPFSLGGSHKADQDSRDMFPYAIQAIEELKPKAFIFENVKGLLRPSFSDYFKYIILRLSFPEAKRKEDVEWQEHLRLLEKIKYSSYSGMKYKVSFKLINAADYGVPQRRERVVIVGSRSDVSESWTFPKPTHSEERLLWNMYVTKEYWDYHMVPLKDRNIQPAAIKNRVGQLKNQLGMIAPELRPWLTVRDALIDVPDPRNVHNIPDHIFRDGARTYAGHTGSEYDWPAKTIKAGGHGVPGGENMMRFPNGLVRYFTVFEAKLIQTFPSDFVIEGSWGEALRQIGNAVPVVLAEKIGLSLKDLLQESTLSKKYSSIEFDKMPLGSRI